MRSSCCELLVDARGRGPYSYQLVVGVERREFDGNRWNLTFTLVSF
jgi:hypothetical protein